MVVCAAVLEKDRSGGRFHDILIGWLKTRRGAPGPEYGLWDGKKELTWPTSRRISVSSNLRHCRRAAHDSPQRPDETVWMSFAKEEVQLWDAETGAQIANLEGHSGEIVSLTFIADGSRQIGRASCRERV